MSVDDHRHPGADLLEREPSGYFVLVHQDAASEVAIDLPALFSRMCKAWRILLGAAALGALIATIIAFQMRDFYRVEVLIAPVDQDNSGTAGSLSSRFGGLAALAGIDLGKGSQTQVAFATLESPGFARDFIKAKNLMPILFAERWDEQAGQWKTAKKSPTLEEAVELFIEDVRTVSEDKETGLVTLTVEWYSPQLASEWAAGMVQMVNERLRADAIRDSEQSVEYLKRELEKANVVELQQAIYRVMETQINTAMLANIQREYAFRVIDAAVPPEEKAGPNRILLVALGAFLGAFLAAVVLFAYFAVRENRDVVRPTAQS